MLKNFPGTLFLEKLPGFNLWLQLLYSAARGQKGMFIPGNELGMAVGLKKTKTGREDGSNYEGGRFILERVRAD